MSYPVIYSERETKFDTQGLGVLSDAISCVVTEERNSSYELEMVYPLIGIHYDEIKLDRIICAVPAQKKEPQPFRIYKITRPLNGKVTVGARHISYQLSYIPVEPFTAANCAEALQGLKIHSKEDNPFTFYTDIDKVADYKQFTPKSLRSRLMGNDGCINDVYGEGDYEFDKYTVKYLADRGKDNGLVIKYGSNLTDLEQEENIENCITGILPYWEANNFGSMKVEMLPERVIETKNADKYPFHRTVPHSFADKFYEEPKEEKLRKVANEYIEKELVGVPDVSLDISFIDLADTDEFKDMSSKVINLCDTVTVQFEKLGVDAKAKVVRTEYDVLADRYNSIKVSSTNASSSLSDTISELVKKITAAPTQGFLEAAIQHATQLINGGLGGHIVISNSNGYPSEILIMDTDNVSTAKNVFRLNMNGWGLSTTGIDGPYTTACTIDGNFNASIINSGEINGLLIKGGTIAAGALDDDLSGKLSSAQATATGAANAAANAIISRTVEYVQTASTVAPSQSDSGWNHNLPAYETGKYIWERVKYVTNDGTIKYSDPVCDTAGVQVDISTLKQTFWADSTGAHVKSGSGGETVVQGDGVHIKVNGSEVAKYTATGGEITQMKVDNYLYAGAHRIEKCTMFGEVGTGFFWNG